MGTRPTLRPTSRRPITLITGRQATSSDHTCQRDTQLPSLRERRVCFRTMRAGVHTFRHSAATGWLDAGIHIKAVSDLLGYSSISVTADVHGHTSDDTARKAIYGLSGSLGL